MAVNAPIIKKIHDQVDKLRDLTALVERKKVEHDILNKSINDIRASHVDEVQKITEKNHQLDMERRAFEASVDRTHLKFADSVEILNQKVQEHKRSIAHLENQKANIEQDIQQANANRLNVLNDITRASAERDEARGQLKTALDQKQQILGNIDDLTKQIQVAQDHLNYLNRDIAFVANRNRDLDMYAARIKKYYEDAGMDIDL